MVATGVIRFGLLLLLWVAMAGTDALGLVAGAAAAALATWTSLRLLPPLTSRPRPVALAVLLLRFPWQALRAGAAVAVLALNPRRGASPAMVAWTPRLPRGRARDAFLAYASLLPGTLPAGDAADGTIAIHALDGASGVAEAMTREEARFARAFGIDG